MKRAVCTLVEGNYFKGLASLVNSLIKNQFSGDVFVGYRGKLPSWVDDYHCYETNEKRKCIRVQEIVNIIFVELDVEFHLTNYKPNFMLQILFELDKEVEVLVYFDPDIIVKTEWSFFEKWVGYGVALVHEIKENDMPPSHPIRMGWRSVIAAIGKQEQRQLYSYINAGFIGIKRSDFKFLSLWKDIHDVAEEKFELNKKTFMPSIRPHLFHAADQDALNVVAMCSDEIITEMGPESMDFINGGWVMSHAVGSPKPWDKNYFKAFLRGYPPTLADKEYWGNVSSIIIGDNKQKVAYTRLLIKILSFLGRFYRRPAFDP